MEILAHVSPTTKKLLSLVIPHVATKWYELGAMLLDDEQEYRLREIRSNFGGDVQKCCLEMFHFWGASHPEANWYILVEALQSPGVKLDTVAFNIQKNFKGAEQQVQVKNPSADVVSKTSLQEDYSEINFKQYESVSSAFSKLFATVQKAISHLDHDEFQMIRNSCVAQAEEPLCSLLKQAPDSHHLFEALALNKPYCNWMRINFLEVIAIAYGKQSLEKLVQRYRCAIFSKPLHEVWDCISHISTKHKFYTELQGKFDVQDPENMTIEDLIKTKPQLAKEIELHIAEVQRGSLIVTWLIPTVKLYQAYLSFLAVPQKSRKDVSVQFSTWIAYLPQHVLQEQQKKHGTVLSSTLLIGYYHGLLLRDLDSDLLTDDMYSTHLLTADEQVVIDSGCSVHQRNWLLLEHVRHMDVQALFKFCESLQNKWPQIGMQLLTALQSSSSVSRSNTVKSDFSSQEVKLSPKVELSKSGRCFEPSAVHTEFLHLLDQIVELLMSCDPKLLAERCEGLMASELHQISLFTEEQIKDLRNCNNALSVLWKLNMCLTWSNHSILKELVGFSNEAMELLDQFDFRLDILQPIALYPLPRFSSNMIPTDHRVYTLLAVRCDQELYSYTLKNVMIMGSMLAKKCEITAHCLQLLAVRDDPTVFYWTIPTCVVDLIGSAVSQHTRHFNYMGILEVVAYPKLVLNTGSEVCFGPLIYVAGYGKDKSVGITDVAKVTESEGQVASTSSNSINIINKHVKLVEASEKVAINAKKCGLVYYKLFDGHFRALWNKKQDSCLQINTTELQVFQILDNMFGYTEFVTKNSITDVNVDNIPDAKQFYESEEQLYTSIKDVLYSNDIEKMAEQQRMLKIHDLDDMTAGPKNRMTQNKILQTELYTLINASDDDLTAVYDVVSMYVDAYEKYANSIVALIDQQIKL